MLACWRWTKSGRGVDWMIYNGRKRGASGQGRASEYRIHEKLRETAAKGREIKSAVKEEERGTK